MPALGLSAGTTVMSADASVIISMLATEIFLQADPSNTATIFIGTSTAQPIKMSAGATITLPVSHANAIYGKTSAGSATINWIVHSLRF